MSDESEIERLETMITQAVLAAAGEPDVTTSEVRYTLGEPRPSHFVVARVRIDDRCTKKVHGATQLEALRNLRDAVRAELVRRRDEHNAAIAMLEEPRRGTTQSERLEAEVIDEARAAFGEVGSGFKFSFAFGDKVYAEIVAPDGVMLTGEGTTKPEALANLQDALHKELAQRRGEDGKGGGGE